MFSTYKTKNVLLQTMPHKKQVSLQFLRHFEWSGILWEFDVEQFPRNIFEKQIWGMYLCVKKRAISFSVLQTFPWKFSHFDSHIKPYSTNCLIHTRSATTVWLYWNKVVFWVFQKGCNSPLRSAVSSCTWEYRFLWGRHAGLKAGSTGFSRNTATSREREEYLIVMQSPTAV